MKKNQDKIVLSASIKYGDENEPWKPNLFTAILQILLSPFAFVVCVFIGLLIILLDLLTVGSQHISFSSVPKKVQMPDGSIRK